MSATDLITKEFLQKFGQKCLDTFEKQSIPLCNTQEILRVRLPAPSLLLGVLCHISAINKDEEAIESSIQFGNFQKLQPTTCVGFNHSVYGPAKVGIKYDHVDYYLTIKIPNGVQIGTLRVITTCLDTDTNRLKLYYAEEYKDVIDSETLWTNVKYIGAATDDLADWHFTNNKITEFAWQDSNNISQKYINGVHIDSIYSAHQADKFTSPKTLIYSENNEAVTDFEGNTIRLPKPPAPAGAADSGESFYTQVKVKDGIVIEGNTKVEVPIATNTTIGGFKLGTVEGQTQVHLSEDGIPYVELPTSLEHRGDLNNINATDKAEEIFQHTGPTGDYVNGYFYKSEKSGFSVGVQLEYFLLSSNSIERLAEHFKTAGFDINSQWTIQVGSDTLASVNTADEVNSFTFHVGNKGKSVSKVLLNQMGIYLHWEGTKPSSISESFYITSSTYSWQQQSVQPVLTLSGEDADLITEEEIENL